MHLATVAIIEYLEVYLNPVIITSVMAMVMEFCDASLKRYWITQNEPAYLATSFQGFLDARPVFVMRKPVVVAALAQLENRLLRS